MTFGCSQRLVPQEGLIKVRLPEFDNTTGACFVHIESRIGLFEYNRTLQCLDQLVVKVTIYVCYHKATCMIRLRILESDLSVAGCG